MKKLSFICYIGTDRRDNQDAVLTDKSVTQSPFCTFVPNVVQERTLMLKVGFFYGNKSPFIKTTYSPSSITTMYGKTVRHHKYNTLTVTF